MFKTYLYIPEKLNKKIIKLSKLNSKSKAEVIREALEEGLESERLQKNETYLQKISSIKGDWFSIKEFKANRTRVRKRLKKLWNE